MLHSTKVCLFSLGSLICSLTNIWKLVLQLVNCINVAKICNCMQCYRSIVDYFEQGKISLQQQLQWQLHVPPRHFQFVLYSASDQKHSCSHLFFQWSSSNHCHRVYILQKSDIIVQLIRTIHAVLCSPSDRAITITLTM